MVPISMLGFFGSRTGMALEAVSSSQHVLQKHWVNIPSAGCLLCRRFPKRLRSSRM